jgi:hydrogenase maturation protease
MRTDLHNIINGKEFVDGEETMKDCIIGVGNELRQDDAIGLEIVKMLRQEASLRGRFDDDGFFLVGSDLFAVPDLINNHENAVIIDALQPNGNPGQITVCRSVKSKNGLKDSYSLHELDLFWQLDYLFKKGYTGSIMLIGIEAACVELGYGLTECLKKMAQDLVKEIKEIIKYFY